MKTPISPKSVSSLLEDYSDELGRIFGVAQGVTINGKYVHWDTLRHRPTPKGLNHEQWWLAIKLARRQQLRKTALRDLAGRPFVYMLPDSVHEGLHLIDSRASGLLGSQENITNPEIRDRFVISSLTEEAITSSQLEGASTTRKVAADMIRSGRRPKDRSERMIFNNYDAMHESRNLRSEPLTAEHVLRLHATLTHDTLDDPSAAGRIQKPEEQRVGVVDNATQRIVYQPPPAEELPRRLDEMIQFANGSDRGENFIHPVIRAILLHFWLAYEHPFEDGNGRTARALFYWAMLYHGYWLFEFVSISKLLKDAPAAYASAFLHTETDGNDLTYFVIHQIDVIRRAIAELDIYLEKKIAQVKRVERILKRATELNHRQMAFLGHAIRHPDAVYTIKSHQRSHNVAYATARADLFNLTELGLLDRSRSGGKTYVFIGPDDLENRLRTTAA